MANSTLKTLEPKRMINIIDATYNDVLSVTLESRKRHVTDIVKSNDRVYVIFDSSNHISVYHKDEQMWLWE